MPFAIITPALIAGAFAERMKFSAMLWFIGLWAIFVYAPIAHWVWGPDGFLASGNDAAWVKVLDFAGGTVVHINAGVAGLMCAIMLGKRSEKGPAHNMVLTFIGASLLWRACDWRHRRGAADWGIRGRAMRRNGGRSGGKRWSVLQPVHRDRHRLRL